MTQNHGYNTPDAGTTDWHIPLNENFTSLDGDVPVVDADANRSDYAPNSGQLFVADDTGAHYVGDGSQWQLVFEPTDSSGGTAPNHVYAANYGSIQNAVDTADPGDVVWLEDGQTIDSTLTIDKNVALFGAAANVESWDRNGLWLESNVGSGNPVIEVDADSLDGLRMEGFAIAGNGSEGDGIHYTGTGSPYVDHQIKHVMVADVGGDGFYFQHLYGCEFENIRAQGCDGAGIHLHAGPSHVHNNTFHDVWAGQCLGGQILETASGNAFFQVHWNHPMTDGTTHDQSPLTGMDLVGGWGCTIENPHAEQPNGGTGIVVDGSKGGADNRYHIFGGVVQKADTGIELIETSKAAVHRTWMDSVSGSEILAQNSSEVHVGRPWGYGDPFYDVTLDGSDAIPIGNYAGSPPSEGDVSGRQVFDSDSGLPAWWDGSQWVRADGSAL